MKLLITWSGDRRASKLISELEKRFEERNVNAININAKKLREIITSRLKKTWRIVSSIWKKDHVMLLKVLVVFCGSMRVTKPFKNCVWVK